MGRALSLTFEPMEVAAQLLLVEDVTERRNAEAKNQSSGALRCLTRAAQPHLFHHQMEWALATMKRESPAPCCSSISRVQASNDTPRASGR